MSLNFFRADCQHPPIAVAIFGLCDNQDGSRAYPDTENQPTWIATVVNPEHLAITFTAIDKCVLRDHEFPGRGRCDAMLTSDRHLYLVELKDMVPPWQSLAISQLESTIDFLLATHNLAQFTKKKAFAANKKRDRFVVIDNESNLAFYRRTGFRLDIQAEILFVS
jgi:hypothetical protein